MKVPCRNNAFQHACCRYYQVQAGEGINPFIGRRYQRGSGLFSDLFRSAVPILKSGAKAIGKKLLKTGAEVISDISRGRDWKEATKERLKESGKELLQDLGKKLTGQGRKRSKKDSRKKKTAKKRRKDIFN